MEYKVGTLVFNGDWEITRRIGSGATGIVYEIRSTQLSSDNASAMKVIRIPQSEEEKQQVISEGMDDSSLTNYFASIKQEIVNEVSVMMELDGHPNIVSLKQYLAVPHEDGIGWDILIRMELLTTLDKYFSERVATEDQVIQVGLDVSSALSYMSENNIVHRDIKPENIFVDRFNRFKVGDFGAARVVEKSIGMSKKGTELYMAPEVYRGEKYNKSVDVYSLGIVLYKLANRNRLPFYPPAPNPIAWSDRENALLDRMNGKAMPAPAEAGPALAEVILKACAYKPEHRYHTAADLNAALSGLSNRRVNPVSTSEVNPANTPKREATPATDVAPKSQREARVKPDDSPSFQPDSEYSVRMAHQSKPEPEPVSASETTPDSSAENRSEAEAKALFESYRREMAANSKMLDELESDLLRSRAKRGYEGTRNALEGKRNIYRKMVDLSDATIRKVKNTGLPVSSERLKELEKKRKDLRLELDSIDRQLDTLPKPKPVGKLVALMVIIILGIVIAIIAMTSGSGGGVNINVSNGTVISNSR